MHKGDEIHHVGGDGQEIELNAREMKALQTQPFLKEKETGLTTEDPTPEDSKIPMEAELLLSELRPENEFKFSKHSSMLILTNLTFSMAVSSMSVSLYYQQGKIFTKDWLSLSPDESAPIVWANAYGNLWSGVYPCVELYLAVKNAFFDKNTEFFTKYKKNNSNKYWILFSIPTAFLSAVPMAALIKGHVAKQTTLSVYTIINGYVFFVILKGWSQAKINRHPSYLAVMDEIEKIRRHVAGETGDKSGRCFSISKIMQNNPKIKKYICYFSALYLPLVILTPFSISQIQQFQHPSYSLGFFGDVLPSEGSKERLIASIAITIGCNIPWGIMGSHFGYHLADTVAGGDIKNDYPPSSYRWSRIFEVLQSMTAFLTWIAGVNLWLNFCEEEGLSEEFVYSTSMLISVAAVMFNLFPNLEVVKYTKLFEGLTLGNPATRESIIKLLQIRQVITRLENLRDNLSESDFAKVCEIVLPYLKFDEDEINVPHQTQTVLHTFLYRKHVQIKRVTSMNEKAPLISTELSHASGSGRDLSTDITTLRAANT